MSQRLPACTPKQVVKALQRAGWFEHHHTGGHCILKHPGKSGARVTVSMHTRDVKIGTLKSVLRQAGLTEDEFRTLLRG